MPIGTSFLVFLLKKIRICKRHKHTHYTRENSGRLFWLDGRLELTNNVTERTVKPFVMARRNFLFCDTTKGADASALCFSVIEIAKRNKLDLFGYLMFLLQELPKLGNEPTREQLLPLLPWSAAIPEYCHLA